MTKNWSEVFNTTFAAPVSPVTERIWRKVYGSEYPDGVDPFSYVSRSELTRICHEIALGADDHLVDVGCGRGGPGLWVAAHTGARLTGVDIAPSALVAAEARARSLGLSTRATYIRGSFQSLPLESGSVDALMSVDAFLFAPHKQAALEEMARVLRPGGRLVMTTWDYQSQPDGRPPQVDDHRPLLTAASLAVKVYDETEDWHGRLTRTGEGLLAAVKDLAKESGNDVDSVRMAIEEMNATVETMLRRVFVVAERR